MHATIHITTEARYLLRDKGREEDLPRKEKSKIYSYGERAECED